MHVFFHAIEARAKESEESMSQKGKKPLPDDETDTVAKLEETGAKKISVTGNVSELKSVFKECKLSKYISDISTSEKKDTV